MKWAARVMPVMTRLPLLGLLLTGACGVAEMAPLQSPTPTPLQASDFDGSLQRLVVAANPRGGAYLAGITQGEGLPVFVRPDGTQIELPDALPDADEIVLAAGPGGQLHAAWRAARVLYYTRVDAHSYEGETVQVGEASVEGLSLAVAQDGRVALSFVRGHYSRSPQLQAAVLLGSLEAGFEDQAQINAQCCGEGWGSDGGWRVTHASLSFDQQGRLHLAYTWNGNDGTVIDYVRHEGGQWNFVTRLAGELQMGAPNLQVEQYAQRVMYFDDSSSQLMQAIVRDDQFQPARPYLPSSNFRAVQTVFDAQGQLHTVGIENTTDGDQMVHIVGPAVSEARVIVPASGPERYISLVPGAAGIAAGQAGELWVPYLRRASLRSAQWTAALAVQPRGK